MANPEHREILKQGVEQWNKWREEHPEVRPSLREVLLSKADLSGANLYKADLHEANLSGTSLHGTDLRAADLGSSYLRKANLELAHLSGASLVNANLSGANVVNADLSGANLSRADLSQANLSWADLSGADISGATLSWADLSWADLSGASLMHTVLTATNLCGGDLSRADFTKAHTRGTIFPNVDLRPAKGLETIEHGGPSTIGIDTIYKSRGKIPEVFLRGCGVPDEFIAYIGSMVGRPIEFYSCFISYSTKDQEFAERLHADLQAKGVRSWFAPHDIKGGRKLHEQIDEAIRLHDRLLLILSEHSMSSEWVNTEIAKARKREVKETKRVLFPVRLVGFETLRDWECFDGDTGKDSAREIREYFIPDFSNWKEHDSYRTAFERLVKDLKAVASGQ